MTRRTKASGIRRPAESPQSLESLESLGPRRATASKSPARRRTEARVRVASNAGEAAAPVDARTRILEAALVEFSRHGYEAASTNAIAAAASVAKGLVFHHFGAKDRLYLAVHAHVLEEMEATLGRDDGSLSKDLFERLHQLTLRKLSLFATRPDLLGFVRTLTGALPDHVADAAAARHRDAATRGWSLVTDGLDRSSLREGLTIEAAVDTLAVLGDGLERRMTGLLAAGQAPDMIAAMAWEHYARVRDGLGVVAPVSVASATVALGAGEGAAPTRPSRRRASRARA